MASLSVLVNVVEGEEILLNRVLSSIKGISDEIVLVDMTESEEVELIGKKFSAKIEKHKHVDYVEPVRNFGISKCSSDWVLILDPDEEVTDSLRGKIKNILGKSTSADYYRITRKNIIFGKWIKSARWWPDYNIRLFKKGCVSWNEVIHSVPLTYGTGADLEAGEEFAIVHYHYESIEQYILRLNRYTTQHANDLIKTGYHFKWRDIINKPVSEFLSRYFFGKGYEDGLHGLALSLLQSFSDLSVYLKVWQHEGFEQRQINVKEIVDEIKVNQKDINYWNADALLKHGGGIIQRIKRKFKLP